jgi:hypothetical protein
MPRPQVPHRFTVGGRRPSDADVAKVVDQCIRGSSWDRRPSHPQPAASPRQPHPDAAVKLIGRPFESAAAGF